MKRYAPGRSPWVRFSFCALGVLALAILTRPVQAQQVSARFAQGTHLFRRILHDLGLIPLRDFKQLAKEPENKLLIVLGETESVNSRLNLREFVEQGGAVLLATDRHCMLRPFGVVVDGAPVTESLEDPAYIYKKSADCIFVQPNDKSSALFENLSVEKGISRVATNRPSHLRSRDLRVFATFPPGCRATGYRNRILSFAAGGDWEQGRILILSDHSVFINAMMWQPDIENFDFAYNCVNWLTQAKRKEVLFLEEGQIQSLFEIPLKEPPLPPLKAVVEAFDKGLSELENDNAFNRVIQNAVRELTSPQDKWLRVLVLVSTALLGLFALARLSQARHRPDKAPASSTSEAVLPATLVDQRHQTMEQEGDFWEAGRALARQGLESIFGTVAAEQPPPLAVQAGWWQKWKAHRQVRRLRRLAYGTEPIRISSRQLRRLGQEIESLKALLARSDPPDPRSS